MSGKFLIAMDELIFAGVELYGVIRYNRMFHYYLRWARRAKARTPSLARPITLNDKYYFRKALDHSPLHVTLSDKLATKDWLKQYFPDIAVPKTFWSDVSLEGLPEDFLGQNAVLKSNHSSGHIIFLNEPGLTLAEVKRRAQNWLTSKHWKRYSEWAYSKVPPRYFVEEMIGTFGQHPLEAKVYTFGNQVTTSLYIQKQKEGRAMDIFTHQNDGTTKLAPHLAVVSDKRLGLEKAPPQNALAIAMKVGSMLDHVRVDLYEVGRSYIFGEATLYNLGGNFGVVSTDPYDGNTVAWDITKSWFFQNKQNWFWEVYKSAYFRWAYRQQTL
ncbi:MAG: ATP-grasp fold amidoligase family protein [Pseudomonadota bacterium]